MEGPFKRLMGECVCGVPDPPEVVKQALLQLWQQQSDGGLGVHADDALARAQGRVSHILVLIGQSLNKHNTDLTLP